MPVLSNKIGMEALGRRSKVGECDVNPATIAFPTKSPAGPAELNRAGRLLAVHWQIDSVYRCILVAEALHPSQQISKSGASAGLQQWLA
jgi:hypothetical protein